ncbi:DUF262 domain-containing protein [Chryseomicrobium sp. FSL W7-1435]|uniref:DUF262 domain-containing protein n=1 Tax=Chryseomicrobium sp. FSL W7-1435 TaxID=2921704 RepID=UPI00315AFC7D
MKYKIELMKYPELKKNASIPKFQRRLVWSDAQKSEFIETLKKGYPFGSILVYKYTDNETISIIDGLQRYSTMNEYSATPNKYFPIDDYVEKALDIVFKNQILSDSELRLNTNKIESIIRNILGKKNVQNSVNPMDLNDDLYKEFNHLFSENINRKLVDLQADLFIALDQYLDIDEIQIPAVIFQGDESELADVFQNLNRGGKKLSKYQVFAAQWSEFELQLNSDIYNEKILNKVVRRYNVLNASRNIEIIDFDEQKMREEKKINLSEFCYALGSIIIETMDSFWSQQDRKKEDLANEIGYSTIGIVLGVSNNKLHEIIRHRDIFHNAELLEEMISNIIDTYSNINAKFSIYLRHPGTTGKTEGKSATNFQILSFFASLWTIKYEKLTLHNGVKVRSKYINSYEAALNNFIYYYIHDIISKRWSGTGDKKLNEIYINDNNRYLLSLEKSNLENKLMEWHDEMVSKGSILFDGSAKTIYTIFSSFERTRYGSINYDFEHVVSRKKLKSVYKIEKVPAGSLGNIMFLQMNSNRSKKELNLYEALQPGMVLEQNFVEINVYPTKGEMEQIENAIKSKNYGLVTKKIVDRGKAIINLMLNDLYKK